MKKFLLVSLFVFLNFLILQAQTDTKTQDEEAIKQTALDYSDGFYSGDASRMERAISPDLNKAIPMKSPSTGRVILSYSTYAGLIELTRAKVGFLDESKRNLQVWVLNINDDVANAKLNSANFNDYLQMVKIDGHWKIINVLWNFGLSSPQRVKDFKPESESDAIKQAVSDYLEGRLSGDAKRLETAIHSEFNRITLNKMPQTGKFNLSRQRAAYLLDQSYSKLGVVDDTKRNIRTKILDIMDAMAVVEISTNQYFEYLQLFKSDGAWKVFNSLVKPNPSYSFLSSLPAMIDKQMEDFSLPMYGGGEFNLSKFKGKNVLLVFPRGWIGDHWCQVCHYQYAELLDMEKTLKLRKKYNLEIAFVLPYSTEKAGDWVEKFPDQMQVIERWKNPQGQNIPASQKEFADYCKTYFSKKFEFKKGEFQATIPILIDADRKVSRSLKLFTNYWDGIKSEQNIPTIFIIDKKGKVQFKYISQTTFDRPSFEYLMKFIDNM